MAWSDVEAIISFFGGLNPFDDQWAFSAADQDMILSGLEQLYNSSPTAATYFDQMVAKGDTITIRQTDGPTEAETIFGVPTGIVKINLNSVNQQFLSLSGSTESFGLAAIVLHEMLHTLGLYDIHTDGGGITDADYIDPDFNYIGDVDGIVNQAMSEVGGPQRGAYQLFSSDSPNEASVIAYLDSLSSRISGSYDQAIVFYTSQASTHVVGYFDSTARVIEGDFSRDLVVALNTLNNISTGGGADVVIGYRNSDTIYGGAGDDRLFGGNGADNLMGDGGLDILDGGSGMDSLTGGLSADVFAFSETDFPISIGPVPQDRITDYNRGTGTYAAAEGDLIDLSGVQFAGGFGSSSTVRLVSVAASGGLPAGALLEVLVGDPAAGNWQAIARLDHVASGEAVRIALTDAQSSARTGSTFIVDAVGNGTTWSISPATRDVAEGNVTISFTITRSGTNLGLETVYVSTTQSHGYYNDGDYVGRLNVPVVFAAGDTSETFTVRINADAVPEGDETFGVIVQSDPRDPLSPFLTSARFTIQDEVPPSVPGSTYVASEDNVVWFGSASQDIAFGYQSQDAIYDSIPEYLHGEAGNDILVAGRYSYLFGGAGDDTLLGSSSSGLFGGDGNDLIDASRVTFDVWLSFGIDGGEGDDTIILGPVAGAGNDSGISHIEGGTGFDTLIMQFSHALAYAHLWPYYLVSSGSGFSEIDSLVESLRTNSDLPSLFVGGGRFDLSGFEQFEYRGGASDDLFLSWGNNMRVALGGAGTDALYADWSTTTAAIVWNVTVNNDVQRTLGNGVVVQSIERVLLRTGSGNDNLVLGDQDDHVETGAGNDVIVTGEGANYVDAGSGNDSVDARSGAFPQGTVLAGAGDDVVLAGAGPNRPANGGWLLAVDGGSGLDRLIVEGNDRWGLWHYFGGNEVGYSSGFNEIEMAIAVGGTHDILVDQYNWFTGSSSGVSWSWLRVTSIEAYEYRGGNQSDLFVDWNGTLALAQGNEGTDTLYADWSSATAGIVWNLTVDNDMLKTLSNGVQVQSIERVLLRTGSGNDNLVLGDQDDHVETGAGNDTLYGRDGADSLYGGEGNDLVYGGVGADRLDGGAGARDRVLYSDSATGLRVDLMTPANNTGIAAGDIFVAVEDLYGSNYNDSLLGDTGANILWGANGNDALYGRDGADSLYGGEGNDLLYGGLGADRLDGGNGARDRAMYSDSATGLRVDLLSPAANTGIAAGDTFVGIEDLYGSNQADSLLGNTGANIIWGANGNDALYGRDGADSLYGGDGNDLLYGGVGADLIDGGSGTRDRVLYSDSATGLRADLQLAATNTGIAAGDTYLGVEDLYGSNAGDSLLGNAGGNVIWGANGNDVIYGRDGADTLYGGAGNDVLYGGNGLDRMEGGAGADSFVFNTALAGSVDTIADFSVVDDRILLENAIFTALTATGTLAGAAFTVGASATTAAHRILYNSATGQLLYDADGNGAGAAVHFATLSTGLAVTAADFVVI